MALCTLCRFYSYPLATRFPGILPEPISRVQPLWVFEKGGSLRRLIHAMKYGGLPQIGHELGECMGLQLLPDLFRDFQVDPWQVLLLPVPLHPKKEKKRGYNQANLLCEGIQRIHSVHVAPDGWIVRRRFTRTQTGLSLEKRTQNLDQAFDMVANLKETGFMTKTQFDAKIRRWIHREFTIPAPDLTQIKLILLVDDVFTTGATLFSLMKTLREGLDEVNLVQQRSEVIQFAGVTLAAGGW